MPANAEIVLEGYIEKGTLAVEGPFGDHTGYYTPPEPFPVFHITAITMRERDLPVDRGRQAAAEDAWLGKATERIFLPALRMTVPEIVDYDLPVAGAFHNCVIVSIQKTFPATRRRSCTRSGGSGCSRSRSRSSSSTSTSTSTTPQVFFRDCANVDPERDVVLSEGPVDQLDHATDAQPSAASSASTGPHKWPEEGRAMAAARSR